MKRQPKERIKQVFLPLILPNEYYKTMQNPFPALLFCSVLLLFFVHCPLHAQSDSLFPKNAPSGPVLNEEMIQNIEMQSESSNTEAADYTAITEQLDSYATHPLRLNSATKEELEALGLLNDMQINNLLDHIQANGKLLSFYELQSIDGFDLRTLRKLFPFVKVDEDSGPGAAVLKGLLKNGMNKLSFRYTRIIESQKGFSPIDSSALSKKPNSRYLGTPSGILINYRYSFQNMISWGLTGKKDPGEAFFKGGQKQGFDFYSAHLYIHTKHLLKTLVIGDYSAGFGQGLISWSGIAFSKTADATQIKKAAYGLHPYTSTNENTYLRGIGTTLRLGPFEITGFFSRKKLDATVSDTSIQGQILKVRSLQTTGLHATPAELAGHHVLGQTVEGGNIGYIIKRFQAGVSLMHTALDAALLPRPALYNKYEFKGNEMINAGTDYSLVFRNFNLFGEAACSSDQKWLSGKPAAAFLQGMSIAMDPRLSFSLLYHNYSRAYHSFYANAFSSSGSPSSSNEQGLYLGTILILSNKTTLCAFYDYFISPWLKYRINAPSQGNDCFIKLNFVPDKRTEIYVHIRSFEKPLDPPAGGSEEINFPVAGRQTNFRIQISSLVLPFLQLRSRLEIIQATDSVGSLEKGFLMAQDLIIQKNGSRYGITLRYALFDTPSGNTRIYAFEHSAPGTFSIPSYSFRGSRTTLLFHGKLNHKLECWIGCARTFYDNKQIISPGTLDEIRGQHKTEVTLQFHWKL